MRVYSPLAGMVVSIAQPGSMVTKGKTEILVLLSMKMEHVVYAPISGMIKEVRVKSKDLVEEHTYVLSIQATSSQSALDSKLDTEEEKKLSASFDLLTVRSDLEEVFQRQQKTLDAYRSKAMQKRAKIKKNSIRENIARLIDEGTFQEYGAFVIAAQRQRRSLDDLIENTPADGFVCGIAQVNGKNMAVLGYDYTVLAGTQGLMNHMKHDRMFHLIDRLKLPVVFFTEGGGGRPGDTDGADLSTAGLTVPTFTLFGSLKGKVPLIGVNSGRCFAGNAALLGCCDIIITTENSSIGMAGPAMIEGGGLGKYHPDQVGPSPVMYECGVIDVLCKTDDIAVDLARKCLNFFTHSNAIANAKPPGFTLKPMNKLSYRLSDYSNPECACDFEIKNQLLLRQVIPSNRFRVYDIHSVIDILCDTDSVLTLRDGYAKSMVTVMGRIHGRVIGICANNCKVNAGAIDSDGAEKGCVFLELCNSHNIPILFLCDTPGFLVGPKSEATGAVRSMSRMFICGAKLTVPFMTIVLKKGYGLGAMAMAGGSFRRPLCIVSWPMGEFGGMGLEGAVKLGFRKELESVQDEKERKELFDAMVAYVYEQGKALNIASLFEVDHVIDPAQSRSWIIRTFAAADGKNLSCPQWSSRERISGSSASDDLDCPEFFMAKL